MKKDRVHSSENKTSTCANTRLYDVADKEEKYWFIRWICMRYERNKLQKEVEELRSLEPSKVHKENLQLKKILEKIKEEYQPIKKRIHNGNSKRSKRYGRK